jgi:ferredoxin
MKLTAKMIKEAAAKLGHGGESIIGIANIERFDNAPQRMHPKNIFPDCKSVISIIQPIPRGTYRGITEGTHWSNYTYYSYNKLNTLFRPMVTYPLACMIEDYGYEATPVYPGVPERKDLRSKAVPGRPAPDININVRIAGVACGLGEMGWSKVFIHPKYGPRVRLGTILTDAELEPDPLIKPGTLCKRCMKCVRDCPGGAIPKPGERPPIKIKIDDQVYEWGDVHMGRCTATHHGLNREASPFLAKACPGFDFDVRNSNISEETAYKMAYTLAKGKWIPSQEFPTEEFNQYYNQIISHTGYYAICGAKGCIRACVDFQEKTKNIDQTGFKTPILSCNWQLPPAEDDDTGGVAEGKFPEEFTNPDLNAGGWK